MQHQQSGQAHTHDELEKINWRDSVGFILVHAACLLAFWVGVSWPAVIVMVLAYAVRMFAITGFYHRYFSHRSYKTSRWFQFVMAFIGSMALQKGPLWWAAHHRHHHRHSDTEEDVHSPNKGFWWSHIGWIMCDKYKCTHMENVKDLAKYPELRWLDKYHFVPPLILALGVSGLGWALNYYFPTWGTSAMQMLIWGFFISTTLLYHGTFTINSLTHVYGKRRFKTTDSSRNSLLLSLVTLGEGWHNNHHRFPSSERQGFYWYEIDISHYLLKMLSWLGIVWDLKNPPKKVYSPERKIFKKPPEQIKYRNVDKRTGAEI
jgi:stearoyl-CoA desaturase (delta-9 desaturase)